MSFTSDITVVKKARKKHACSWCGQIIQVGESYSRYASDYDGFTTVKVHDECLAAMIGWDDNGDGFLPGDNPRGCNCGWDRSCKKCHPELKPADAPDSTAPRPCLGQDGTPLPAVDRQATTPDSLGGAEFIGAKT